MNLFADEEEDRAEANFHAKAPIFCQVGQEVQRLRIECRLQPKKE